MASLVYIDRTKKHGAELLAAIRLVQQGFAEIYRLNAIRAQLIGTSSDAMQAGFGTDSPTTATDLSARMAAFETAHEGSAQIGDFLNATIDGSPPA